MNAFITTSYVSRMCTVPPLVATAGLQELIENRPVLAEEGWELRFDPRAGSAPLTAVLTSGWALRAGVTLEVEPWSRSRVIVGMRHRARAVPWWSATYFTSAHEAVAMITTALRQWADQPLRSFVEDELGLPTRSWCRPNA